MLNKSLFLTLTLFVFGCTEKPSPYLLEQQIIEGKQKKAKNEMIMKSKKDGFTKYYIKDKLTDDTLDSFIGTPVYKDTTITWNDNYELNLAKYNSRYYLMLDCDEFPNHETLYTETPIRIMFSDRSILKTRNKLGKDVYKLWKNIELETETEPLIKYFTKIIILEKDEVEQLKQKIISKIDVNGYIGEIDPEEAKKFNEFINIVSTK